MTCAVVRRGTSFDVVYELKFPAPVESPVVDETLRDLNLGSYRVAAYSPTLRPASPEPCAVWRFMEDGGRPASVYPRVRSFRSVPTTGTFFVRAARHVSVVRNGRIYDSGIHGSHKGLPLRMARRFRITDCWRISR